jgi:hypothetical protein
VALVAALPVLISYNKLSTSSDSANLRQIKLLGVLFIDEAQVLLTTLSNRFLIGTGDQKPSSLRYWHMARVTCIFGTGLSIDA